MAAIRTALRAPSAHALLDWASVTIETLADRDGACTDPSHGHPVHAPAPHRPTLLGLVESFVEVPCTETTAALHILRALSNDDDVRAVATHGLATRRHPMPLWLAHLDEARCVPDVVRITEELGDSTSWIVGVRLVGGEEIAFMLRTDTNALGEVADAFPLDRTVREAMTMVVDTLTPGMDVAVVDGAAARAALTLGFKMSDDVTLDDVDPDDPDPTWPRTRPVARWAVSLLPDGGAVPSYDDWDDARRDAFLVDLLDSPELAPVLARDPEATASLARLALDVSLDVFGDDPERWSPRKLAILLLDHVPRKVIAPSHELLGLADVMAAWVERSIRVRGLSAEAARDLRAAMPELAREFRHALDEASAHPSMSMQAILDATGLRSVDELAALDPGELMALLPVGFGGVSDDPGNRSTANLLAAAAGGVDRISGLTTEPLPDEPFDPSGVPADVLPRLTTWLGLAETVLARIAPDDVELRTALRRTAAAVAVGNPDFLRRKSDDVRGAAALLTLVLQAHGVIGWNRVMRQSQIVTEFGLTGSVTQRMEPMLRGLGISRDASDWGLGDPALLTSRQRTVLIDMWDEYGD